MLILEPSPPCILLCDSPRVYLLSCCGHYNYLQFYHSHQHTSLYVSAYAQEQCFSRLGFSVWTGWVVGNVSITLYLKVVCCQGAFQRVMLTLPFFTGSCSSSFSPIRGLADGFKRELIVLIYIFLTTSKVGSLLCLLAIRFSFSMSCVFISYPIILLV